MADIYKGILGPARGKIDGLVGRYMHGKAFLQSKGQMGIISGRIELSPAQETMRLIRKVAYCAPQNVRRNFHFLGARIGGVGTAFIKNNWSHFEGKLTLVDLPNNMMKGNFGTLPYSSARFFSLPTFVRFSLTMPSDSCPWQNWYGQVWVFNVETAVCVNTDFQYQVKFANSLTKDILTPLPNGTYLILVAVKRDPNSHDMYNWATFYRTI